MTDDQFPDDPDVARLLASVAAVLEAEDARVDAEQDTALLDEADEAAALVRHLIRRGEEIRQLRGKPVGGQARRRLEMLYDELTQLATVLGVEVP